MCHLSFSLMMGKITVKEKELQKRWENKGGKGKRLQEKIVKLEK